MTDWHGELYGVLFTIKSTGSTRYETIVSPNAVIVDTTDFERTGSSSVQGADGAYLPDQLGDVNIAPGDKRSGWVYYELKGRTPRLLRYTVFPGSSQVGEWTLE